MFHDDGERHHGKHAADRDRVNPRHHGLQSMVTHHPMRADNAHYDQTCGHQVDARDQRDARVSFIPDMPARIDQALSKALARKKTQAMLVSRKVSNPSATSAIGPGRQVSLRRSARSTTR